MVECPWEGKGLEKQGWGSVAGQPALAFDNTGCERAVLGMSPPLRPPIHFPQQGQVSVSYGWKLCHFPRELQWIGKLISYPEVLTTPPLKSLVYLQEVLTGSQPKLEPIYR